MTVIPSIATLCRLMLPELPETIDPMRFAKAGKVLSGSYESHQLSRLMTNFDDVPREGQVSFNLEFSWNDKLRIHSIYGEVKATFDTICQRCVRPMTEQIIGEVKMAIISDENAADNIPEEYEPYVDSGETVKLHEFVEDELLLAMPLVPMHKDEECPDADKFRHKPIAKENPFAELKNLKLNN